MMRKRLSRPRPPLELQEALERAKALFRAWGAQGGDESVRSN